MSERLTRKLGPFPCWGVRGAPWFVEEPEEQTCGWTLQGFQADIYTSFRCFRRSEECEFGTPSAEARGIGCPVSGSLSERDYNNLSERVATLELLLGGSDAIEGE